MLKKFQDILILDGETLTDDNKLPPKAKTSKIIAIDQFELKPKKREFLQEFTRNFRHAKGLILVTNSLSLTNKLQYNSSKILEYLKQAKELLRERKDIKSVAYMHVPFIPFTSEQMLNNLKVRVEDAMLQTMSQTKFIDISNVSFFDEQAVLKFFDDSTSLHLQMSKLSEILRKNVEQSNKIDENFISQLINSKKIPIVSEPDMNSSRIGGRSYWKSILSDLLREQKLVIISFSKIFGKRRTIPKFGTKEYDDYLKAEEEGVFAEQDKMSTNHPTMQNGFSKFQEIADGIVNRNEMSYSFNEALDHLILRGIAKKVEKQKESEPFIEFAVNDQELLKEAFGKDYIGFF